MAQGYHYTFRVLCFVLAFVHGEGWIVENSAEMSPPTPLSKFDLDLSMSVSFGAKIAIKECGHQFRYEHWDCPKQAFHSRGPSIRETAFIHAITAAGIAHTLTKNCSNGEFGDCGCGVNKPQKDVRWKWSGCSDNFHFGDQVAKKFLDGKSLANLHNNEAGRVAVRKTMKRVCKCHGVSGSCATQTCWTTLADFRAVGNYLKKMYKQALRVDYTNGNLNEIITENNSHRVNRKRQTTERASWEYSQNSAIPLSNLESARRRRSPKIKKRKLVFLQDSPNYCRSNAAEGIRGVIGRSCIAEPANEPDPKKLLANVRTCAKLCKACGLKIHRKEVQVASSCNCRFQWCCQVTCQTCSKKRIEITCVV
ncbi:protein Wnt-8-like [Tigriopus californicus]|uniref:protein Wnt-8-like n=1 Tax=Tigriopus californicus TaxID=6832 RepID=UPI0027DA313B|nr:protein Wnt-8-like [Tigriopus californicus]